MIPLSGSLKTFLCILFLVTVPGKDNVRAQDSPRKVSLSVVVDSEAEDAAIANAAMEAIAFASKVFEEKFQDEFVTATIESKNLYPGEDTKEIKIVFQDAQQIARQNKKDITLVFSTRFLFGYTSEQIDGEWEFIKTAAYGNAMLLGNAAVIQVNQSMNRTTLHELLHLFGADDIHGGAEDSIMRTRESEKIDEKSHEIVLKNRDRSFEK